MNDALQLGAVAGLGLLLGHALHKRKTTKDREAAAATPPRGETTAKTPPPRATVNDGAISRRFDPVFEAVGHGLPVPYLRALAYRESGLDPHAVTGDARGLLQVVGAVRDFYNRRHRTDIRPTALFDPTTNVRIGSFAIATMIDVWAKRYPDVPNLRPDWTNPEFVGLVTLGWNAGWSDEAGIGRVVRHLRERGLDDITVDRVHHAAPLVPGATRHLSNPRKVGWAKSVVRRYLAERARDHAAAPVSSPS